MAYLTVIEKEFLKKVEKHGGFFNAHNHIDRAGTAGNMYIPSMTMQEKQSYVGELHRGPFYKKKSLIKRMSEVLDESINLGVKRFDSFIDVAIDIPLDDGLGSLNTALELKEKYKDKIDFRVGAYPIFGFKDSDPKRWDLFVEAAKKADFLGTLPERDDFDFYKNGRDHIGFREHFKRTLDLAGKLKKPIHYHVDQKNIPTEFGTKTLIDAIKWSNHYELFTNKKKTKEPLIWAVHVLSPSCYEDDKHEEILNGLDECNIGTIICPDATISMLQESQYKTRIHNSIGRVSEILERGIPLRLGVDNINDDFMRWSTPDMITQVRGIANYTRFDNNPSILAKIACGKLLDSDDLKYMKEFLNK